MTEAPTVARLIAHVKATLSDGPFPPPSGWQHMGAVICDAVIQAGLSYESTVLPRVIELQKAWPDATTVSRFVARLDDGDLETVLDLHNQRKLVTIADVARTLQADGVETADDLRAWLDLDANRSALLDVKGVGPKTLDYIGSLVGRPGVAVDRHLRAFAAEAGVPSAPYNEIRSMFEVAADQLGHDRSGLEHAVWRHMSRRRR